MASNSRVERPPVAYWLMLKKDPAPPGLQFEANRLRLCEPATPDSWAIIGHVRTALAAPVGRLTERRWHRIYFARRHTVWAVVPKAVAGLVYFSSSAVSEVITRLASVPT